MPRFRVHNTDSIVKALGEKLTLGRYWQNPIWLQRQLTKRRISQMQINILRDMIVVMEQLYPEKWDFDVNVLFHYDEETRWNDYGGHYMKRTYTWHLEFMPVIKIGDGVITNTAGEEHTIKQLYFRVRCPLKKLRDGVTILPAQNTLDFQGLDGTRTERTLKEAHTGYIHSHMASNTLRGSSLMSNHALQYRNVCIGHGDTLAIQLMDSLKTTWDIESFRALIMHLETVAFWESVEGMPHMYMSQAEYVVGESEADLADDIQDYHINDIAVQIKRETQNKKLRGEPAPQLTWTVDAEGNFSIIDDEKFEDYLRWKGNDISAYMNSESRRLVVRGSDGREYKAKGRLPITREAFGAEALERVHYIIFRGEKVYLTLTGEDEPDIGPVTFYLHSSIKEYVKRELEQRAKKHSNGEATAARKDAAHWLSRLSNARKGIESNQVPVQGNQQGGVERSAIL